MRLRAVTESDRSRCSSADDLCAFVKFLLLPPLHRLVCISIDSLVHALGRSTARRLMRASYTADAVTEA